MTYITTLVVSISSLPKAPATTTLPSITTTLALLTCTASLSNLNWHYPCGLNTVCFKYLSTATEVRCECTSGYVGNASAGCTKLNVLFNATRVLQGSLSFPVAWQTGLNDSTSAVYQSAVAELVFLLEKLMSSIVGYVQSSVSPKKFRFALSDLMSMSNWDHWTNCFYCRQGSVIVDYSATFDSSYFSASIANDMNAILLMLNQSVDSAVISFCNSSATQLTLLGLIFNCSELTLTMSRVIQNSN